MIISFDFTNLPSYMNDVPEVIRAFSPYLILDSSDISAKMIIEESDGNIKVEILSEKLGDFKVDKVIPFELNSLEYKRLAKREAKKLLYIFCNKITGIDLPYGSLTGVRPTKLYYDLIGSSSNIKSLFTNEFSVEYSRAELIENVVNSQKGIYSTKSGEVDIFVNIPICPTRCKYCSFISTEYSRVKKLVPLYVDCVKKEILDIKQYVEKNNLKVRSIYFGGGTPTSLSSEQLRELCSLFDYNVEFTVEAGRPDSITLEKLQALKDSGVTRISINPQTFKDDTLVLLGRAHNTEQLYKAYELARKFPFDINMDLIAGLPNETFEDFCDTLHKTIALSPENVTVHTLSLKRGSTLKTEGSEKTMDGSIKKMVDYSIDFLTKAGYAPYYMYRQKNMADGLENVGWCKPRKQCIYNIDYMEETTTVLSAGAGAMSKIVYHDNGRIERNCNPKGFEEYLRRKGAL